MNTVPHAPCGARRKITGLDKMKIEISIRSLRVGRDKQTSHVRNIVFEFQSTRPVWGETGKSTVVDWYYKFQSTRPVWGETFSGIDMPSLAAKFQSTRPVWGETSGALSTRVWALPFQSTRPVWGET